MWDEPKAQTLAKWSNASITDIYIYDWELEQCVEVCVTDTFVDRSLRFCAQIEF